LLSQHTLAVAYRAKWQTKEAVGLPEHVAKVQENMLAETPLDRLVSQHKLAIAYNATRQTRKAIKLLQHVVKVEQITMAAIHLSQ
jgi:hypothetical protein